MCEGSRATVRQQCFSTLDIAVEKRSSKSDLDMSARALEADLPPGNNAPPSLHDARGNGLPKSRGA